MHFKNDKQRKAVMAQLNSGKDYSYHNPQINRSNKDMLPTERRQEMMRQRMKKSNKVGKLPVFVKSGEKKGAKIIDVVKTEDKFITTIKKDGKESFITSDQPIKTTFFKNPNKDSDNDGVPDFKDCEPFNPKKQGLLHEVHVKMLRKQEEKLERAREKALRNLEDTKDKLKEKQAISSKKASISQLKLKQKQAIIDEANREKNKLRELKQANADAKRQLDELTISGRTKTFLKRTASKVGKQAAEDSKLAFQRTKAFIASGKIQKTLKKINKHIPG